MANHFASQWLPPALRRMLNRAAASTTLYRGPYSTWIEADNASNGYESEDILARVSHATSMVLRRAARYEQDGTAFHDEPPAAYALTAILLAAAAEQGKLHVLDFGGGLGSHFLRWRRWVEALSEVRWCVVEQAHFVAEGAPLLAGIPEVSFAASVEQARDFQPNAVLISSVLQYLPDPLAVLNDLASLQSRIIVIDRTPFSHDGIARILTQHVPRSLGAASYPLWTLSRAAVHEALGSGYRLLAEFPSADVPIATGRIYADYAGCVWLRKA